MGNSYDYLIERYFPPEEWDTARCIMAAESGGSAALTLDVGLIDCGSGEISATKWGLMGILDACWNPAMSAESPFTAEQWAKVLDANYNVWMASVIWSQAGWRSWTTFDQCPGANPMGGPIPYPRGPVLEDTTNDWVAPLVLLAGALGLLAAIDTKGRGRY